MLVIQQLNVHLLGTMSPSSLLYAALWLKRETNGRVTAAVWQVYLQVVRVSGCLLHRQDWLHTCIQLWRSGREVLKWARTSLAVNNERTPQSSINYTTLQSHISMCTADLYPTLTTDSAKYHTQLHYNILPLITVECWWVTWEYFSPLLSCLGSKYLREPFLQLQLMNSREMKQCVWCLWALHSPMWTSQFLRVLMTFQFPGPSVIG